MIQEKVPGIKSLSSEEKVHLAAELYADAAGVDTVSEVNPKILALLKQRLADFEQNPNTAIKWTDFKRVLKGLSHG